jgi:hypothetical protein
MTNPDDISSLGSQESSLQQRILDVHSRNTQQSHTLNQLQQMEKKQTADMNKNLEKILSKLHREKTYKREKKLEMQDVQNLDYWNLNRKETYSRQSKASLFSASPAAGQEAQRGDQALQQDPARFPEAERAAHELPPYRRDHETDR